jgi:hypothetical protein
LIQVGEALMEAHAIGYVHRDLRPRNLYLAVRRGKANFVKLLDFGLAKLVESDAQAASTSLGMTFGDPRYMSPEQARGDRIDRRADIYQLGCIAYEMLSGTPPFTGNRVFDILSKQVTEVPTPLPTRRPGIPLWMEAAVAKMLAKDPEDRFATTTRMVEALRRGLETGEVMEDDVARRRESIPPPSVSRVMQKMGIPAPVDVPVLGKDTLKGHLDAMPAPATPAPSPVTVGKHTVKGHIEGPLPPMPAQSAQPPLEEPRRRTGTPQVGVPEVQAPVTGLIEPRPAPSTPPVVVDSAPVRVQAPTGPSGPTEGPAGRKRLGSQAGPGDSASWFEDGERASEEADDSRARKLISPSTTDLSLYDESMVRRRRWPLVVGVLAALGLVGAVAFALTSGGDEPAHTAEVTQPEPPPTTDVPPSQIITPPAPEPALVEEPAVAAKAAAGKDAKKPSAAAAPTPRAGKTTTTKAVTTDDSSSRRPGGDWFSSPTPTPTPAAATPTPGPTNVIVPPPSTTPAPTGVSGVDGPQDPYGGGGGDAPGDGAGADKKAEFFAGVGQQQLGSGDTAGAAASFKKALELDPKLVPAMIGMGEIALRQGLFGDAIAHLKKAAKAAPKSSRVFTLLGEAYLNSGNHTVAADNFKKALQLDPDNVRAREGFDEASAKVPPPEDD